MKLNKLILVLFTITVGPLAWGFDAKKQKTPFDHLKYRSIGPATGGRVCRVAGVVGDPLTYYAATAAGGVWKSEDGGINFKPITDEYPIASVGSLAVAPSDHNVIYIGTGEANIRGNVARGNGIWKSTDTGKHWHQVWKQSGQIGSIVIHPQNADIAYAAVLGHAFAPNPERGIYRTKDGGKTWVRVLFVAENAGGSDVCLDPNNPRLMYAGIWQTMRKPWSMTSGGPNSGIYKSQDGGDSWHKLVPATNGLPAGPYGKTCFAISPADSKRIFAMIEAEKGGLYRSDDGGENWSLACEEHTIRRRPWYFSTLTADPTNANVIWAPNVPLMRSLDAGKSFQVIKGTHHADHHDCWIDPTNPKRMIVCHDGGVDISVNGGTSWYAPALPLAQFYHVSCDDNTPYRVLGCMQDQGSASGPSNSLCSAGIVLGDWYSVGGGEAGYAVPVPGNPDLVYAGEYSGIITRYDHRTKQSRHVGIYPFSQSGHGAEDLKYRFQWTAPILVSRHNPRILYHASNILFRSKDGGQSWESVSLDMTRDDKNKQKWSGGPITGDNTGVEVYGTIFSVAESPLSPQVIWLGSDDGLVHISRSFGLRWENVTPNIPDLPDWGTVCCIEASPFSANVAYLVVDGHRLDDYKPYVWKTSDFGATWKPIVRGLDPEDYCHVIREDPHRKGLLYLGTESGVKISWNDGETWQPLSLNMPTVAVHDLVVKNNDLVVATMGRSIWILDDLTPLQEWKEGINNEPVHLFTIQPCVRWRYNSLISDTQEIGKGDNPAVGAVIRYYLRSPARSKPNIEILSPENKTIKKIIGSLGKVEDKTDWLDDPAISPPTPDVPNQAGVNTFVWDLTHEGARYIPGARVDGGNPTHGPEISPGIYSVIIEVDGKKCRGQFEVKLDPRVKNPRGSSRAANGYEIIEAMPREADPNIIPGEAPWLKRGDLRSALVDEAREQERFCLRLRDDISAVADAVHQLQSLRQQAIRLDVLMQGNKKMVALQKLTLSLKMDLDKLEEKYHNPKARVTYDILAQPGGARLYSQLVNLYEIARTGDGFPTQGMIEQAEAREKEMVYLEIQLKEIIHEDVVEINEKAKELNWPLLSVPDNKK